jgi:predicted DNA-binding transcriptional regulator YafY
MRKLELHERRVEILKLLQGREMRIGEIAEYFGVDDRTIRSDIQALRDGMNIFGVKIEIDSKHEGSQHHYYKSTVHPIMLALNSSELYALLKLLENEMLQERGEVYKHIFEQVYSQITDYAEGLIADKLKNKYEKTKISNLLEEDAVVRHKNLMFVYWMKSGRFIAISYRNKDGVMVNKEVRLIDIRNNDELIIRDEQGNEHSMNYKDMVIDWTSVDYK